jgi:hypothetical protein
MKKTSTLTLGRRQLARAIALCGLVFGLVINNSHAVILFGSGDPAYNTTAPDGVLVNSGWQYQGQWGGFLGTPIAPQYFIAARHVGGSVGQQFTYNGTAYYTTAYWDDTNTDLRIWKVDGVFPNFAPLYSLTDEVGKTQVVIGRGTQRGEPVAISVVQTNYATNIYDLRVLGISSKTAKKEFPTATFKGNTMTLVTSEVVTNDVLKGWKTGPSDSVMRWGQNQVYAVGNCLIATFDQNGGPNEAYLSGGDSSGGVFIQDGGVWKLAGINYGIDGPFGISPTDSAFYAALFDESGLYVNGALQPNDGKVRPAFYYATRISTRLTWIQSIISQ